MLASAAIPNLLRAVRLADGTYWDGLFSQNPPIRELLDTGPDELWVIQINPQRQDTEPTTLADIADRRNELAGNLSLYQELAFIEKIDQLLARERVTWTIRARRGGPETSLHGYAEAEFRSGKVARLRIAAPGAVRALHPGGLTGART